MSVVIRPFQPKNPSDINCNNRDLCFLLHKKHGSGSFEHEPPSMMRWRRVLKCWFQNQMIISFCRKRGYCWICLWDGPHKDRKGYDGTVEDRCLRRTYC